LAGLSVRAVRALVIATLRAADNAICLLLTTRRYMKAMQRVIAGHIMHIKHSTNMEVEAAAYTNRRAAK